MLDGCSTTGIKPADWPEDLPPRTELQAVPFFPQTDHYCGPAALATGLQASGVEVTPEQLVQDVYLPKRKGSLQTELTAGVRRYARVAYPFTAQPLAAWREVAAGHPVIVLQNLGLSWYPRWHYAVLIGFDRDRREVTLRSGEHRRYIISEGLFMRTWARANYWALMILPPNVLPATAQPADYVRAVSALERASQYAAARTAYETALARWPQETNAWLGLGNSAYGQHDLSGAEAAFRRAAELDPQAGAAFNNLAQVLLERGALDAAHTAAARAIANGGALIEEYRRTQAAIERAQQAQSRR